jgi:hypothetical protein
MGVRAALTMTMGSCGIYFLLSVEIDNDQGLARLFFSDAADVGDDINRLAGSA